MIETAGKYIARATNVALARSKAGNPMIVAEFEIRAGEYAGETITWWGSLAERAIDQTLDSLRTMGWRSDSLDDLTGSNEQNVELVVESEIFDGRRVPKIRWINRPGARDRSAALERGEAKAIAAQLRGAVLAHKAKTGSAQETRQPMAARATSATEDDDIPF